MLREMTGCNAVAPGHMPLVLVDAQCFMDGGCPKTIRLQFSGIKGYRHTRTLELEALRLETWGLRVMRGGA